MTNGTARHLAAATLATGLLVGTGCGGRDGDELSRSERIAQQQEDYRKFEERQARRLERQQMRDLQEDRIAEKLFEARLRAELQAEHFPTQPNLRRAELARSRELVRSEHSYRSNGYDCPPDAPVNGNWSDNGDIYHLPGWVYYGATIPEECFKDAAAAHEAGYRPSRIRR